MSVLIAGRIGLIADAFAAVNTLQRVVLTSPNIPENRYGKNVTVFKMRADDALFGELIDAYNAETIVYFLARSEETCVGGGSVDELRAVLEQCVEKEVCNVVVVSSSEVYSGIEDPSAIRENTPPLSRGGLGAILKSAEEMCGYYVNRFGVNITILRVPYIYCESRCESGESFVSALFSSAMRNKRLLLPGSPDTMCDFVCDKDVAQLMWAILNEGLNNHLTLINVSSGGCISLRRLVAFFEARFPSVHIAYTNNSENMPVPLKNETAKNEYGWIALHSIEEDLPLIMSSYLERGNKKRKAPDRSIAPKITGSSCYMVIEFIVATAVLVWLLRMPAGHENLMSIDIRLVFVVLMSAIHGTLPGIAAAVIAVATYLLIGDTIDLRMIIYNAENWLPIALYLVVGTVLGYIHDKAGDDKAAVSERNTMLRQEVDYLARLYGAAIQHKKQYKEQILGYSDSFGRIYSITQRLNLESPEYVLLEAINVLEDILNNTSIMIYSVVAGGKYARLNVRSVSLAKTVKGSISLSEYSLMMEKLNKKDIWVNTCALSEYPAYCAPVYDEDRLIAIIAIRDVAVTQLTPYYCSLFKIICGLIQDSLIRAINFNELHLSSGYYSETRIMKPSLFIETYNIHKDLAEKGKADFGMVAIMRTDGDMLEQSGRIEICTRESDIIGYAGGQYYYVILHNTVDGSGEQVLSRLLGQGLKAAKTDSVFELERNAG